MIYGIEKSSLIDYEGYISTVVFLGLCNMNCFYCHNRNILSAQKDVMSTDDFISFIKSRIPLIDAVVISGGEPTIHGQLIPFIKQIRELGFRIKLDTNGSNPAVIKQIIEEGIVDYIALDIKGPSSRYPEITSSLIQGETVYKTLSLIIDSDISYCVRTTMVPTITVDDLKLIAYQLPKVDSWKLQWYRPPLHFLESDKMRVYGDYITPEMEDFLIENLVPIQPNLTF